MTVLAGTVVAGKIEVPPLRLNAAEEEELTLAMEAIRRGDYVDGRALLAELRALLED